MHGVGQVLYVGRFRAAESRVAVATGAEHRFRGYEIRAVSIVVFLQDILERVGAMALATIYLIGYGHGGIGLSHHFP